MAKIRVIIAIWQVPTLIFAICPHGGNAHKSQTSEAFAAIADHTQAVL